MSHLKDGQLNIKVRFSQYLVELLSPFGMLSLEVILILLIVKDLRLWSEGKHNLVNGGDAALIFVALLMPAGLVAIFIGRRYPAKHIAQILVEGVHATWVNFAGRSDMGTIIAYSVREGFGWMSIRLRCETDHGIIQDIKVGHKEFKLRDIKNLKEHLTGQIGPPGGTN